MTTDTRKYFDPSGAEPTSAEKVLGEMARAALPKLNVIMDEYAACDRHTDADDEALWRVAGILRNRIMIAGFPDPWPVPRVSYAWRNSCMRPTAKGTQCRLLRQEGAVACYHHEQSGDAGVKRAWQDAVHYPFKRVNELAHGLVEWFSWAGDVDYDPESQDLDIIAHLQLMREETR